MELQFASAKSPGPLRLAVNASPFPRPNWGLEDWHLQNSPQQHHLQHRHAAISSSASGYTGVSSSLEEAMQQQMTLQSLQESDSSPGPFPERPGEPDCTHYIRTGHCSFGMSCRYNHPPDRKLAAALARDKGEYPERIGQPECQYYLKTGSCKFGSTCKFHHPREIIGYASRVSLNILGFPLRLGEKDCPYYMRTGLCKFGAICKFNHPPPATVRGLVAMSGSSMYASNGSPAVPSPHPFPTGMSSWSIPRAPYMPRSRFQSPSNFGPLIVQPQNIVSVPGWSTYQARMGTMASLDVQQPALGGSSFMYGSATSNDAPSGGIQTTYNPYVPGSAATGLPSAMQSIAVSEDSAFPERPGQPDCQYYMKTGDCKFGMSCRYHHPKERVSSLPKPILSPIGLPLRHGVLQCAFYMQYGMCKFGPTCKFDHPIGGLTYSPSASSLADMPIAPYPVGLSVATLMPSSSDTAIQEPKMIRKGVENAAGKQQGYEDTYLGSSAGETSNARLGTAGSNRSSNADSVELIGDSSQDLLNGSS